MEWSKETGLEWMQVYRILFSKTLRLEEIKVKTELT